MDFSDFLKMPVFFDVDLDKQTVAIYKEFGEIASFEELTEIYKALQNIIENGSDCYYKNMMKKGDELEDDSLEIVYEDNDEEEEDRISKSGYVYFLKCQNLYKIGTTKANPEKRLETYNTNNPFEKELLFLGNMDNCKKVEEKVIKKFKHKIKAGREWFELTEKEARKVIKFLQKKAEEIEIE